MIGIKRDFIHRHQKEPAAPAAAVSALLPSLPTSQTGPELFQYVQNFCKAKNQLNATLLQHRSHVKPAEQNPNTKDQITTPIKYTEHKDINRL